MIHRYIKAGEIAQTIANEAHLVKMMDGLPNGYATMAKASIDDAFHRLATTLGYKVEAIGAPALVAAE
ncbi:hypothetical protein BVG79_01065 [Ketogulonicigenium robustum]|uniref:Uncharacterized protein n=1 Tax=Ketogulonicigenium robustum TaxID=92947 RepID=A0A1W6NZ15_9RHOB|nr:hypothetical protein [Ketogulonicigenium robustum]ARO14411.1 hypothetical protein BVG79_01065 [Ketogulonicigenium robustum]